MRVPWRVLALAVPLAMLAAACSGAGSSAPSAGAGGTLTGRVAVDAPPKPANDSAQAGVPTFATSPEQGIPSFVASPDRNLILTANVAMRSQDPWATADRARTIAVGLGGDLLSLSQSGNADQRSATLTVRVPSSRFDDALRQLKQLDGEVVSSTVDGKDVTDQFVDLQARLAAKQAEEAQYLALMARADKIDDILKIQQSLSNVRTQIEQLQGQVNSIKSRTDFSTISMSVTPLTPGIPVESAGAWDPVKTFAKAISSLAALFRVAADLAIWTLVFAWIPLLALGFVLFASRARRPGAQAS